MEYALLHYRNAERLLESPRPALVDDLLEGDREVLGHLGLASQFLSKCGCPPEEWPVELSGVVPKMGS